MFFVLCVLLSTIGFVHHFSDAVFFHEVENWCTFMYIFVGASNDAVCGIYNSRNFLKEQFVPVFRAGSSITGTYIILLCGKNCARLHVDK